MNYETIKTGLKDFEENNVNTFISYLHSLEDGKKKILQMQQQPMP